MSRPVYCHLFRLVKKQMAFQASRQRTNIDLLDEEINGILSNNYVSKFYLELGKDLDVLDPKHPDDICKLSPEERGGNLVESAKLNMASTFVNAFVNAGMQRDSLLMNKDSKISNDWFLKVKNEGLSAATASIGMIFMWDQASCSEFISEFLELKDGYARLGAGIAVGLCNTGIIDEFDQSKALLTDMMLGNE